MTHQITISYRDSIRPRPEDVEAKKGEAVVIVNEHSLGTHYDVYRMPASEFRAMLKEWLRDGGNASFAIDSASE